MCGPLTDTEERLGGTLEQETRTLPRRACDSIIRGLVYKGCVSSTTQHCGLRRSQRGKPDCLINFKAVCHVRLPASGLYWGHCCSVSTPKAHRAPVVVLLPGTQHLPSPTSSLSQGPGCPWPVSLKVQRWVHHASLCLSNSHTQRWSLWTCREGELWGPGLGKSLSEGPRARSPRTEKVLNSR